MQTVQTVFMFYRNYYSADLKKLPQVVSEFLRVIHSDAAFLVLSNLTGLKLHPLAPADEDEVAVNGKVDEPSSSSSSKAAAGKSGLRYCCYYVYFWLPYGSFTIVEPIGNLWRLFAKP